MLRTAAAAYPALSALLGTNPFRFYDTQLVQGSAYPAIVTYQVSDVKDYSVTARLVTGWTRVQFTIWGGQADPGQAAAEQVLQALLPFLDQFNGTGIPNQIIYPNNVVNVRRGLFAETDPPIFQRLVDVKIFYNDGY